MKLGKAIGTVLLCILLLLSTALLLGTALLRFVVLNPAVYKSLLPSQPYCNELRARISDNLDHVAILYGLEEGTLDSVVTDEQIRSYTAALIDALFDPNTTDTLNLPAYPAEGFADYLRTHTAYSEQAALDFSEDCAASVTEDLAAVDVSLLVSGFSRLRNSRLYTLAPVLLIAALALTAVLIAMLLTVHAETPRTGAVAVWGGLFMGVTVLFVPLFEFWLFDYVGRLNLVASAFKTILSGLLHTALYASLALAGALLLVTFVGLWIACAVAAHGPKAKARRKKS